MTSRCLIYDDIVAFDKTVAAKKLLWAISDVAGHFYPIMEHKKRYGGIGGNEKIYCIVVRNQYKW